VADFPVVDTLITDAGPVTLVLLDSCRHRSTHILSNAVGKFGDDQLGELERILAHTPGHRSAPAPPRTQPRRPARTASGAFVRSGGATSTVSLIHVRVMIAATP
jgi:hypothetical protein